VVDDPYRARGGQDRLGRCALTRANRASVQGSETADPYTDILDFVTALGLIVLAFLVGTYGSIIGAGGGFLLIPALALVFGLDGPQAVGTGAATLALIHVSGALTYDRRGLVARPVAGWFAVGSVPVALLTGWLLTNRFESEFLLAVIGALLVMLALFVVVRPLLFDRPKLGTGSAVSIPPRIGRLVAGGVGVGFLSGTFAVGGGLVTVPYLAQVQKLTAHRAAATTAAAATAASFASAIGHSAAGNVVWTHTPLLVLGAIAGASAGARWAGRLSEGTVLGLLSLGLVVAGLPLMIGAA